MQLELIAQFLSQYLQVNDGLAFPAQEDYIRDGIRVMVEEKIMTIGELRREALAQYNVIIPWYLCPQED